MSTNYSISSAAVACKVVKHIIFILLIITHKPQLSWKTYFIAEYFLMGHVHQEEKCFYVNREMCFFFCEDDHDCKVIF